MTQEENDQVPDLESRLNPGRMRKYILAGVLTVILGAIGSGIWEVIFRPSLNHAGSLVTRLSEQADNAVFTTAALDPLPVPALFTLLILAQIPMMIAMFFLLDAFLKYPLRDAFDRWHKKTTRQKGQEEARRIRRKVHRRVALFGSVYFIALYAASYAGFSILNEGVLVSRVFHRNLAISLPVLSSEQHSYLLAQFASMKTRKDFQNLVDKLDQYARSGNVRLEWYKKKS